MRISDRNIFFGDDVRYSWIKIIYLFFRCRLFHTKHHVHWKGFNGWACSICGECGECECVDCVVCKVKNETKKD